MFSREFENKFVCIKNNFSSFRKVSQLSKISIDLIFVSVESDVVGGRSVVELEVLILDLDCGGGFESNGRLVFSGTSGRPFFLGKERPGLGSWQFVVVSQKVWLVKRVLVKEILYYVHPQNMSEFVNLASILRTKCPNLLIRIQCKTLIIRRILLINL